MVEYTDAQKRELESMFAQWQTRLGLTQWLIRFQYDQPPNYGDGAVLEIDPVPGRNFANLRVGTFFDQTQAQKANAVCHECLHLGLEQLDIVIREMLEQLAPQMREAFRALYREQVERVVDWLANVIAPMDEPG